MADGSDPRPDADRPPLPPRAYHDIRDDYDDEFGRALSPREVARRRLLVPGVALVVIGVLLILGVLALAVGVFVENFGRGSEFGDYFLIALLVVMLAFGSGLFGLVVAGGLAMLRLRHWLALFAAYVVTGLSIAGCYAHPFLPVRHLGPDPPVPAECP